MGDHDSADSAVRELYAQVLKGWNDRSGKAFAEPFADDAEVIGFDGSLTSGRDRVAGETQAIFNDHQTARYVAIVKSTREPKPGVVIMRAAVGMIAPGSSDLMPERNAWHTVVAAQREGEWRIVQFQNTPARFDGRPQMVEEMTQELRQATC